MRGAGWADSNDLVSEGGKGPQLGMGMFLKSLSKGDETLC